MPYFLLFILLFVALFPILSILLQWKIKISWLNKYGWIYGIVIMMHIGMLACGINWKNIDNFITLILLFSISPIFFNHIRKKFLYLALVVVYLFIIFSWTLYMLMDLSFERKILLSNDTTTIYMESIGWSWSDMDGIIITGKYKMWLMEKEFFKKTYQDVNNVEVEQTNTWILLHINTSTWWTPPEKIQ